MVFVSSGQSFGLKCGGLPQRGKCPKSHHKEKTAKVGKGDIASGVVPWLHRTVTPESTLLTHNQFAGQPHFGSHEPACHTLPPYADLSRQPKSLGEEKRPYRIRPRTKPAVIAPGRMFVYASAKVRGEVGEASITGVPSQLHLKSTERMKGRTKQCPWVGLETLLCLFYAWISNQNRVGLNSLEPRNGCCMSKGGAY